MESRTQRRMAALSRHLQPHAAPDFHIHHVLLSGQQRKQADLMPVVIGGMVLDVLSTPSVSANPRSTTPGKVDFMLGGVARNIGEGMAKLGTKCYMISALGCDMAGELLLAHWKSAGLPVAGQSLSFFACGSEVGALMHYANIAELFSPYGLWILLGIRQEKQITTATVNCIFDVDGELVSGVANVESVEKFLTREWIQNSQSVLFNAPLLVLDANVTPATLEASCQMAGEFNVPVWFEPVSVAKSKRVASVAKYITFVSPNELELIEMANALSCGASFVPVDIDNSSRTSPESLFQMLKSAILVLLENGIKFVLVTLGPSGLFLCSRGITANTEALFGSSSNDTGKDLYDIISRTCPRERYSSCSPVKGVSDLTAVHYPALDASVVRVSGAGDCLVGGVIASLCSGLNIMQSVAVGVAAAKAAIEVETNVPVEYNLATIADDAGLIYSVAKVLI